MLERLKLNTIVYYVYDLNKPAFSQDIFILAIILDGDDDSSIKESGNDDNPEPANEEVNIANAVQTSTPDQGRLNSDFPNGNTEIPKISFPNSQTNSSLEDSQGIFFIFSNLCTVSLQLEGIITEVYNSYLL